MKLSKQKLIQALEKEKKYFLIQARDKTKNLWTIDDVIRVEYAEVNEVQDIYNSAIDKAISIVNSMKGEE